MKKGMSRGSMVWSCVMGAIILLAMLAGPAQAQTYTWVGTNSNSQNSPANWNPSTGYPHLPTDIAILSNSAPYSPLFSAGSFYEFEVFGSTNWAIAGNTTVTNYGNILYSSSSTNVTTWINTTLVGTGGLMVTSGWLQPQSSSSTFSGPVQVQGGILDVSYGASGIPSGAPSYIGSSTNAVLIGGTSASAELRVTSSGLTRNLTVLPGAGQYTIHLMVGGTSTFGGTNTLNTNVIYAASVGSGSTWTLSQLIQGSGGVTFSNTGVGYTILANTNNSFTGPVVVAQGTIQVSGVISTNGGMLGMPGPNGVLTLGIPSTPTNSPAGLRFNAIATNNMAIAVNGPAAISASSSCLLMQPVVVSNNLTIAEGGNSTYYAAILAPISMTGTGSPMLTFSGAGTSQYQVTNQPNHTGGTLVTGGNTLQWSNTVAMGSVVTFGLNTNSTGPGTITLDGVLPSTYSTFDLYSTNGLILNNPFVVTANGGALYTDAPTNSATNTFSGPITLGGMLQLGQGSVTSTKATCYPQGTMTINQSVGGADGLYFKEVNIVPLASTIVDGTGSAGNSLLLRVTNGSTHPFTNTANHAFGTYCEGVAGIANLLDVKCTTPLGVGDIWLSEDDAVRLNQLGEVAAGARVGMWANEAANALLILATNSVPSLLPNAAGILALDSTFSTITSEAAGAALGNGQMFLGSYKGGTLASSTLSPGVNNTYRLGGGSGTLQVNNGILTGTASLLVGPALPSATPFVSTTYGVANSGTILLLATNTYSGGTTINPGATLNGQAPSSGNGSPFGSTNGTVTINNGTLELTGTNVAEKTINLGTLTVNGSGALYCNAPTATNTLAFSSVQAPQSPTNVIFLYTGSSSPNVLGVKNRITISNNPPVPVNGMVSPCWLCETNTSGYAAFATYNNAVDSSGYTYGFQPATNSYVNFTNFNSMGSASQIANFSGPAIPQVIPANSSVYALSIGNTNMLVVSGLGTITVGSGGLIVSSASSVIFTNGVNVNLCTNAVIQAAGPSGNSSELSFAGQLAATNLTIAGAPQSPYLREVLLLGNNVGSLFGTISAVGGGCVCVTNDNGFGGAGNQLCLDGGLLLYAPSTFVIGITNNSTFSSAMPIYVGPGNGDVLAQSQYSYITFSGPITGPGLLYYVAGATAAHPLNIAGTNNTYSGGSIIYGTVTVASNSTLGVGDVQVQATLNCSGNSNIGGGDIYGANTTQRQARLALDGNATVNFYCLAPSIGSLSGAGVLSLSNNAVLTVGGDNTSTIYAGVINQISGTGTGASLTKTGSGTFWFKGNNQLTNTTLVSGGTFVADGVTAGGITVNNGATLVGAGSVGGAVTLQNGATFIPGSTETNSGTAGRTTSLSAGSLAFASGSTIMITISNATTYTQINAGGGAVTLGNSTLQVTLLPGYTPGSTDSFAIITNAASIGGVFTGMNNNSRISVGNGYMATITYASTAVTLSNLSRGASGSTLLFW